MNLRILTTLSLLLLSTMTGCRTAEEKEQARAEKERQKQEQRAEKERRRDAERQQKDAERDAAMHAKLPGNSPFLVLHVRMREGEVLALLGEPTSRDSRQTGAEYIPFNFGGRGSVQTTWFYKGKGRVVFLGATGGVDNSLVDVVDDPNEIGYATSR